jgi:hypothetical protein
MSYGTYKDPYIQLKDTFLLQYELGREVPALIQLLAENSKDFDIQWRTVMTRVVGAIAGRRKGKVCLLIGEERMSVLALIANFIFSKTRPELSIYSTSITHKISESPLCQDVIAAMDKNSEIADVTELMRAGFKTKGFLIAVLQEKQSTQIRQVVDHFSKGNSGILFVLDYARHPADSHYQHVRELGLRMIELPDGSGELICL